ncbi:glycerol-3-phosphate 1-O-acyltransferase [Malacoplasma penetrans]|uniref:Glycerol-3-phosphate acyltransferase n=1 Tax=Malacoplasma penetrans (strain HF-2) TaxID=272633 RepID=PLSY_MALP2|nr:glycerol-3-phosphate 1-O-acyltransferase PlsY [Malacoplasma penetrans]P59248.1 RecName: Full=Glycerol-3-phosphate acyltransferase; AltName: Full=Acyl-PO4 G3P acyltransferase; AltName: Full=Acyl-phosphate--glycerol-3-phosphate acyltransferase; AltName: Full=G3P acyltransferase; Short=GPAT; AltName: Full=Lysophosphatidic acid synthase; Short=LPA synthase [Malacoplasma penetrans HF-2]RXY97198.1 glycerol-3-phosphate 1-O-acyltransferase [Malacoplasma penetrans]BAC44192.1 putative integral membrane
MNIGNLIGIIILFLFIGYFIGNILFGILISKSQGVDIRTLGSGNVGATNVTRNLGRISGAIVMVLDFFKSWFSTFVCLLIYKALRYSIGDESAYANAGVIIYLGGFAAIIGHCFPCFYFYTLFKTKFNFEEAKKYSGGKGVSSAAGFAASISPWMFFICFVLFWSICLISKYVSLASIVTVFLLPIWSLIPHLNYFYMLDVAQANINPIPPFNRPFEIAAIFNYSLNWWYILVTFLLELLTAVLVIYRHKENIVRLIKGEERKAFAKKTNTH